MMLIRILGTAMFFTMTWFIIIAFIFLAEPVEAEVTTLSYPVQCAPHGEVVAGLKNNFGEEPVIQGIAGQGSMLEVFASPTTGTWTIVVVMPNGQACMVASGSDYTTVPNA